MDDLNLADCLDPEAMAGDLLRFLEVRSETGDETAGSLYLSDLLRREGLETELEDAGGRPNVYARIPGRRPGAPVLVLNGHTDTIPIGVAWPPRREDGWIVGRGAEDMKGGLVAMVHAAAALRRAGLEPPGDVWLTGVVGHETPVGKKEGPRQLIRRLRAGAPKADGILIVEGPRAIWAASLGSTVFTLTLRSARGPIHTLHVPYSENPARWAGRILERLAEWEARAAAGEAHPLCGRERVNVGIVRGGDFMNRLPTPLEITGQRRWLPGRSVADVRAEFEALAAEVAAESGLEVSVHLEGDREPFETPADHPLVRGLSRAVRDVSGSAPEIIGMALVGDANLYANEAGVPTVYYGPQYRTAHSDDERVELEAVVHAAHVYARMMLLFGETG